MAKSGSDIPSLYVTYSSGYVRSNVLADYIEHYGGEIACFVIRERVHGDETRLTYALFYKATTGAYFDIAQVTSSEIKTLLRADRVMSFSESLVERCGDKFKSLALPTLTDDNVILPGELHQRWLDEMRAKGEMFPDPLPKPLSQQA